MVTELKMVTKRILAVALFILTAGICAGQPITITVVEWGEYERSNVIGERKAKKTTAGAVKVLDPAEGPKLKVKDTFIRGSRGVRFGVKFRVDGPAFGSKVPVQVRMAHPPMKRPGAKNGTTMETWDIEAIAGTPRFTGWSFDEEWEIAKGEWFFQIYYGDEMKAEQRFVVQ